MKHKIAAFFLSVAAVALSATALFMPAQVSYAASATQSDYSDAKVPDGWYKDGGKWYYGEMAIM